MSTCRVICAGNPSTPRAVTPTTHSEWAAHLNDLIWIDTPREERLRSGVDRDRIAALGNWDSWMANEDAQYERDPPRTR